MAAPMVHFAMFFRLQKCASTSTLHERRCENMFVGALYGSPGGKIHVCAVCIWLSPQVARPRGSRAPLSVPPVRARPLAMPTVKLKEVPRQFAQKASCLCRAARGLPGDLVVPMTTFANLQQDTWARCLVASLRNVHARHTQAVVQSCGLSRYPASSASPSRKHFSIAIVTAPDPGGSFRPRTNICTSCATRCMMCPPCKHPHISQAFTTTEG